MKITRRSKLTGTVRELEIPCTPEQLADWESGTLIQNAMPDLLPHQREFVLTGITEDEWNSLMGNEKEPDE